MVAKGANMADSSAGGQRPDIPDDPASQKKIRDGLNDDERAEWDELVKKVEGGGKPNKKQKEFIRRLKAQGKISQPSKKFRNPSDKKTHQDP